MGECPDNMERIKVIQLMEEQGLVPLFYNKDLELCKKVIKACYDGGARLLEFTNRGVFAHEVFTELSKYVKSELPKMALGVGSVPDAATAALFIQCGADFVVTPSLREDVAVVCNRRKVLWAPGCASLTEIGKAEELGCEIVKLFPGSVYGPKFIQSVMAPQPWTKIMPTGGVSPTEENLKGWFGAGAVCVGMGSKLISKELIANKSFDQISKNCKESLTLIQSIR